jgi:sterol desaturase/sphingolipid hydroxylase (fatty acid hydroxylase superfamily)
MVVNATYGAIAIGALFMLLAGLERAFALRRWRCPGWGRWVVNVAISALAIGTGMALVRPAATAAMQSSKSWRFGLLQWIELPPALALVVAVLLLDLSFYFWHLANHRVPLLWRFHVVHHIDPDLDVSTAFRFHFGEVALSAVFRIAQIMLIGASPFEIALYELAFQANTLFQHSNIRMPIRLERVLSYALVTPRMHGIHHSMVRQENTSNFSVVFSFWDRLRRTLILNVPQQDVAIGIPAYEPVADNRLIVLLPLPFRAQRDPWQHPDGTCFVARKNAHVTAPTLLSA